MRKEEIAKAFLSLLEGQLSRYEETLAETRRQVIDAPSANQSHSDTSKSQLSGLALGQEGRLKEIELTIRSLKSLDISPRDRIVAGAVFTVESGEQGAKNYFMFPGAQPAEVQVDGVTIMSISAKSPIGVAVLGKRKGEKVSFSGLKVEITGIW